MGEEEKGNVGAGKEKSEGFTAEGAEERRAMKGSGAQTLHIAQTKCEERRAVALERKSPPFLRKAQKG